MHNHAPTGYLCPFCVVSAGEEHRRISTRQSDVIYRDEFITAFIAADCWPNNKGHVLIIPNTHHENIYELPDELAAKIHAFARKVSIALKAAYGCDGTSTRQHNEPWGNQDVWHYHLHVFPRYEGDELYRSERQPLPSVERIAYAEKLRAALADME